MRFDGPVKWYLGAGLAAVLVLVAGWFLLVSPQMSNASDIAAQAQQQDDSNARQEAQIAQLQAQYKTLPDLQAKLALIQTHLPDTPQIPGLLRNLSAAAATTGVSLQSVSPGSPAPVGATSTAKNTKITGLAEVPLSMTIQGQFANVKAFLAALETMPRSVLVTGVNISRGTGGTNTGAVPSATSSALSATITAKVFTAPAATSAPATSTTTTATTTTSGS